MKRTISASRVSKFLASGALMLSAHCIAAQSPYFSLQILGEGLVFGINDAGEAVGVTGGGSSVCPTSAGCIVIWRDGAATALGAVTSGL